MRSIKRVGPKLDSLEIASLILRQMSRTLPGYIHGHVDAVEKRCVYYVRTLRASHAPECDR
jgi:hypothetical protein